MPLLLVFVVAISCLHVPWPEPIFGHSWNPQSQATVACGFTILVMMLPLIVSWCLTRRVISAINQDPLSRSQTVQAYSQSRRLINHATIVLFIMTLFLGWGWTVWNGLPLLYIRPVDIECDDGVLFPGAELIVALPYLITMMAGWVIGYPAERVIYETNPRIAYAETPRQFWSLGGYVLHQSRQMFLFLLLPAMLFATQQGVTRIVPSWAASGWLQISYMVVILCILLLMPLAVKPVLGLVSLPEGAVRQRLVSTAHRLGFRYRDMLVWPTQGVVANAMVLGMIPQVRYVVFTDRLLESLEPDELDAVLGHEVGHVRHHHIPYYVSFFLLSSLVATATAMTVEKYIKLPEFEISSVNSEWMILPPIAGMVAYLFTVFGFLSRRCERQADIFGGRAGSCHNPSCTGHDADTVLSPQGQSVCPTGVRHLIHALERVCELNGSGSIRHQTRHPLQRLAAMIRSWQHGPIRDRVDFLHQIAADPTLAERTERRINRFRFVLMSILIAILMLMGMASGWRDIWKWM